MIYLIELPTISGSKETMVLFFTAIFLFFVSVILFVLEKGLKKKIKEIGLNKSFFYRRQIKEIKKYSLESDAKQLLALVNAISKSFFRDYLGLQREATYEELAEEFDKLNDSQKAGMCRELSELVYSTKDPPRESVVEILEELERIIVEEGVISEQTAKRKETIKKNVETIKVLYKEGMKSLARNDSEKAEEIYANITKLYKRIDAKNQLKFQSKLLEFYKKLSGVQVKR
jgi:hypothetical protein